MAITLIKSNKIVLKDKIISGVLEITDDYISNIYDYNHISENIIDKGDVYVCPGIIDIHTHGFNGYPFSGTSTYLDLKKLSLSYAEVGVTSVVATSSYNGVKNVVEAIEKGLPATEILGVHLEGPFLNSNRFGAAPPDTVFPEPSLTMLEELLSVTKKKLMMMTLAPEIKGSYEIIQKLRANDVLVAVGHSDATYADLEDIKDEVDVMTHLGNASSGISHRNMGAFGYGLLENVYSELICDFIHVEKEMLDLIFRVKDMDEIIMISDSIALGNCPPGEYDFISGKLQITTEGKIVNEFNHISGSSYPIIYGMKRLREELDIQMSELFRMASLNPSKLLGVEDKYGSLEKGKIADIIIVNEDMEIEEVFKNGKPVYTKGDKVEKNNISDKLLNNREFLNFYANRID